MSDKQLSTEDWKIGLICISVSDQEHCGENVQGRAIKDRQADITALTIAVKRQRIFRSAFFFFFLFTFAGTGLGHVHFTANLKDLLRK